MHRLQTMWTIGVYFLAAGMWSGCWAKDSYVGAYLDLENGGNEGVIYGELHPTPAPRPYLPSLLPQTLKILAILLKILLKITFFKILVKFLAIICLFLFIPTLDFKSALRDMMETDAKGDAGVRSRKLELAQLVSEAIEKYSQE